MARLETTALSSFTFSSRVSSGSAGRKEPHEQQRGNISPMAHKGRCACSSLCTAALQLQSRVPDRVRAPIPIAFDTDATLSLATVLPLLLVSSASARGENSGCAQPCASPSTGGSNPHPGTPQNPERGCQVTFPCHSFQDTAHKGASSVVWGVARRGVEGWGPGTAWGLPARGPGTWGPGFASRWSIIIILQRESTAPECSL